MVLVLLAMIVGAGACAGLPEQSLYSRAGEQTAEGVFQKDRSRLVRLAPTPRDSSRIPAEQYVLTLMVRRLE